MSWLKNREIQLTQQETALFINAAQSYLYRTKELQKKTKKKLKPGCQHFVIVKSIYSVSNIYHVFCPAELLLVQIAPCVVFWP